MSSSESSRPARPARRGTARAKDQRQDGESAAAAGEPTDEDRDGLTIWQHIEELDAIMAAIGLNEFTLTSTADPGSVLHIARRPLA